MQFSINSVKDLEKMSNLESNKARYTEEEGWFKSLINLITCSGKITFTKYAAELFRNILKYDKSNSNYLVSSFDLTKNVSNIGKLKISEWKSGIFFFFTYDNRFLIKTISIRDSKALLGQFLMNYYNNICKEKSGISSLMGRIYGL